MTYPDETRSALLQLSVSACRRALANAGSVLPTLDHYIFLPLVSKARMVASTCGNRYYYSPDQTCWCIRGAEGDIRSGKIPSSCYAQLCQTSADCALLAPGDIQTTDSMLGPLQDNGGPMLTYAPLPGSPVIDRIPPAACPLADQRGLARPQGRLCDIGAVEQVVLSKKVYLPIIVK